MAEDPVCRMAVERENGISAMWDGDTYYFCSRGCRAEFLENPTEFAHSKRP